MQDFYANISIALSPFVTSIPIRLNELISIGTSHDCLRFIESFRENKESQGRKSDHSPRKKRFRLSLEPDLHRFVTPPISYSAKGWIFPTRGMLYIHTHTRTYIDPRTSTMLRMSRRFLKETGRKRSDFIRDSLRGIFSGRRWSIWIVWKKASVDRARRYDSAIGSREEKSRRGQWKEGVGKFPRVPTAAHAVETRNNEGRLR